MKSFFNALFCGGHSLQNAQKRPQHQEATTALLSPSDRADTEGFPETITLSPRVPQTKPGKPLRASNASTVKMGETRSLSAIDRHSPIHIDAHNMGWGDKATTLYAASEPGFSAREHDAFYTFLREENIQFLIDLRPTKDIIRGFNQYYPDQPGETLTFNDNWVTTAHKLGSHTLNALKYLIHPNHAHSILGLIQRMHQMNATQLESQTSFQRALVEPAERALCQTLNRGLFNDLLQLKNVMHTFDVADLKGLKQLHSIAALSDHVDLFRVTIVDQTQPKKLSHSLTLVHYLRWADFKTIPCIDLKHLGDALLFTAEQQHNALVHCRGGMGRSGTLVTYAQAAHAHGDRPTSSHEEATPRVITQIQANRRLRPQFVETDHQFQLILDTLSR